MRVNSSLRYIFCSCIPCHVPLPSFAQGAQAKYLWYAYFGSPAFSSTGLYNMSHLRLPRTRVRRFVLFMIYVRRNHWLKRKQSVRRIRQHARGWQHRPHDTCVNSCAVTVYRIILRAFTVTRQTTANRDM